MVFFFFFSEGGWQLWWWWWWWWQANNWSSRRAMCSPIGWTERRPEGRGRCPRPRGSLLHSKEVDVGWPQVLLRGERRRERSASKRVKRELNWSEFGLVYAY
ncbi:hypothetical protein BZA77DRAFT_316729 [Pyronema omphalodes]|nr:hypothetical protein BZA77DRAFT_316729 [Pyronema omphalodes]